MMDTSTNIGDYQRLFHLKVYTWIYRSTTRVPAPPQSLPELLPGMRSAQYNTRGEPCARARGSDRANRQFQELALQVMEEPAKLSQTEIDWILQLREKLVIPEESTLFYT
jgi:hypothetical protein